MDFDNSWSALFRPGRATRFFAPAPPEPPDLERPFSLATAWWMAEISRLVYRRDPGAGAPGGAPSRAEILSRVGWEELAFFDLAGTQASILRGRSGERPFRVLAFRGTEGARDWVANLQAAHSPWMGEATVHSGFKRALEAAWQPIERALDSAGGPWFYTGHSLGGGLATLAASRRPPYAAYSFGAPRVGDAGFAALLEGAALFRWVNHRDPVTRLPPAALGGRYRHAGTLCLISSPGGPDLEGIEGVGGRLLRRRQGRPAVGVCGPPGSLTDHTPVNYVAQLERLAAERQS